METLNKETFCNVINEVMETDDYQHNLNNFFRNNHCDGYIFQPTCTDTTLKLLHYMFEKEDAEEWISLFAYEYDFGRRYKNDITDNGKPIPFSTPSDLYDLLMSIREIHNELEGVD